MFTWSVPPEVWKITNIFELRARWERRQDADYNSNIQDNKTSYVTRFRGGFQAQPNANTSFRIIYQYLTDKVEPAAGPNINNTYSDLYEANLTWKHAKDVWTFGRQVVAKGDERIFAGTEWGNFGRTFDGVRFTGTTSDLFAGRVGVGSDANRLSYAAMASHKSKWGETMAVYKSDGRPNPGTTIWTLDHIYKQSSGPWKLSLEGAAQTGTTAGKRLASFMAVGRVTRALGTKTTVLVEAQIASGGGNANESRTFDMLWPSNHQYYGGMDVQGLRNMIGFQASITHALTPTLSAKVEYNKFQLYDAKDAWYNAGGAINKFTGGSFVDPTGSSGKDVGQEFDFVLTFKPAKTTTLQTGISTFLPGSFVKAFVPTGTRQVWGFFMAQFRL